MEKQPSIISLAKDYVLTLFSERIPDHLYYHSYNHTAETVKETKKIASSFTLSPEDEEVLILAAWFHDTGYANGYYNHEEESAKIAEEFLRENQYPTDRTAEVKRIILSTRTEQEPVDLMEKILHDADLAHVGKKNFFSVGESLRMEWEALGDKKCTDLEWEEGQLQFLSDTQFYTEYVLRKRQPQRIKNLEEQRKRLEKAKRAQEKTNAPGRGTETMYRALYRNHIELSSIADSKANMMISINTIIMSVIITVVGSGFSLTGQSFFQHLRFTLPIVMLLATTLASVIFAILSASPNVTNKRVSREDLVKNKSSVLFFGNFSEIPMDRFLEEMTVLRGEKDLLYDNMTVDIYHLGKVLTRKYRLLKISYMTFLGGLVLSAVTFLLIFLNSYSAQP